MGFECSADPNAPAIRSGATRRRAPPSALCTPASITITDRASACIPSGRPRPDPCVCVSSTPQRTSAGRRWRITQDVGMGGHGGATAAAGSSPRRARQRGRTQSARPCWATPTATPTPVAATGVAATAAADSPRRRARYPVPAVKLSRPRAPTAAVVAPPPARTRRPPLPPPLAGTRHKQAGPTPATGQLRQRWWRGACRRERRQARPSRTVDVMGTKTRRLQPSFFCNDGALTFHFSLETLWSFGTVVDSVAPGGLACRPYATMTGPPQRPRCRQGAI